MIADDVLNLVPLVFLANGRYDRAIKDALSKGSNDQVPVAATGPIVVMPSEPPKDNETMASNSSGSNDTMGSGNEALQVVFQNGEEGVFIIPLED